MKRRVLSLGATATATAAIIWVASATATGQTAGAKPAAQPATAKPAPANPTAAPAVPATEKPVTPTARIKPAAPKPWTQKTPWGDPDLQGIYQTIHLSGVPVERPAQYGDRRYLTEEEMAKQVADGQKFKQSAEQRGGTTHWWEWYGRESNLTSIVTSPSSGQIPWKPEVLKEYQALTRKRRELASWTDLDLWERCLTRGLPVAMIPSAYNAGYHIMQIPGYVVILYEMFEVRTIPLDGRPVVDVPQYFGNSKGHWDGNTLVVEVSGFSPNLKGTLKPNGGSPSVGGGAFIGTGSTMKLVERFTRTDADTIVYEGTVTDPTAFTAPWTITAPMRRDDKYEMFEYACHEGNYFIPNLLRGTRLQEAEAGKKGK